jgi:DNA-binding transcriptional regulator YiaG
MKPKEFRRIQKRLGVSNSLFASILGVTHATIMNWRQGKVPVPGPVSFLMRVFAESPEARAMLEKRRFLLLSRSRTGYYTDRQQEEL